MLYIVADVGPYVALCVGADVVLYVVLYVVPAHLPDGKANDQVFETIRRIWTCGIPASIKSSEVTSKPAFA